MQYTLEQQEKMLKGFMKNRWMYAGALFLGVAAAVDEIFRKRSQWPLLFHYPSFLSWHSIWENIFTVAMLSFVLIAWWVRIHNYRRDLLLAEQEALRKAETSAEGVWPPPPVT